MSAEKASGSAGHGLPSNPAGATRGRFQSVVIPPQAAECGMACHERLSGHGLRVLILCKLHTARDSILDSHMWLPFDLVGSR